MIRFNENGIQHHAKAQKKNKTNEQRSTQIVLEFSQ